MQFRGKLKPLRYPIVYTRQLINEIKNELITISGQANYDCYLIFIAGLPKSGTSWLEKLVSEIPGFTQLNGSFLRHLHGAHKLEHTHGINREMLNSAPKNRYSFIKLHTHYEEKYINVLDEFKLRPTILIRDLRDMLISRYYHVMADPNHWQYGKINSLPFEEGFEKSLFGISHEDNMDVINYYTFWISGWFNYLEANQDKCYLMRFEDMKKDLFLEYKNFLSYYNISFSDSFINQMLERQKTRHVDQKNLSKNLNLPGRLQTTFRKGISGEWKNLFSKSHKDIFKDITGDLLIKLGYEKDLGW